MNCVFVVMPALNFLYLAGDKYHTNIIIPKKINNI